MSLVLISLVTFAQHDHSKMSHSGMDSKKTDKSSALKSIMVEHSQAVTTLLDDYIALKNALVADNGEKAASSAKMLREALGKFDLSAQSESQQKELTEIIEDASENAEHISENSGKLDHQREHFEILSTDIKDMIVITGADRSLFQIHCPMYNNMEGGNWLSESKEVMNPLFGSKMIKCGNVQLEINVK